MPTIEDHPSQALVKALIVGHSGAGKTGLLASLPPAGYRLFIQDFDNGLDVLRDPKVLAPAYRSQVIFKTFTDKPTLPGAMPTLPRAGVESLAALDNWTDTVDGKLVSYGGVTSWGPKDVIVIDSMTFQGRAFMQHILGINKRLGQQPWQSDWGDAMRLQEDVCALLYSDAVKCNVVVLSHLVPLQDSAQGPVDKLFPSALGSKLPPKIMRYFNNVIQVERQPGNVRVLKCQMGHNIDLKTSKPSSLPAVMPADLAEFFKLVRG